MKQNITIQPVETTDFVTIVENAVANNISGIANVYSTILGEEVSIRQTFHLLNAQFAFLAIVLPVGSLMLNAIGVAWFALALRGCRNAGLK